MALVNPNIAMSFRMPEFQPRNALAEYAQIQQIQGGQQAQELARFQLGAAQRAEAASTVQNELFAKHFDPTKGGVNVNAFVTEAAQRGQGGIIPGFLKTEAERQTAAATLEKTRGEIEKNQFALQEKKFNRAWQSAGAAATPQIAIDQLTKAVKSGEIDMATATREIQNLQNMTPDQYKGWRANAILKLLDAKDQLGFMLPKITRQEAGGQILSIQDNPMMPGYGQPIAGAAITKTPTIGERTAQGQLSLAQQKFAFEKANPTMSIQEDPSGLLAVNTRTGVATPVVYGPNGIQAAPVAPAAAPGAGMPGPRLPAPTTQAIPGMTSVLDRTTAPTAMPMPAVEGARTPGTPVRGTKDAPAKFNDTDMQLAGLAGSLKEFRDEVGKKLATGAKFLPAGADTARMQAKYTSLLMGVKDLYTLGALAGPDMSIIESQLTNPASWAGKMTSQKGFEEQIKVIEDMLKRSAGSLETTYSRQPKATKKALESLGTGLPGSSATNPLGLPGIP
jgi:hypothetical protein